MKAVWQGRMASVSARAADYAPIAPACCNACRVCTTNNIVALAAAGVVALSAVAGRLARRLAPRLARSC
jgi:hypothetical protein